MTLDYKAKKNTDSGYSIRKNQKKMAKPGIEYDFDHPKWIKKAKRTFTMFDMNSKDGRVDYQDFTSMLRDVAAICKPSKAELENAYRILEKIANEIGIGPNDMGQNLEEWIEATRKFGTAELAREALSLIHI